MPNVKTDVIPYTIGLCFMSVCALAALPVAEVVVQANTAHPTGLDHGWHLSEDNFRTGEPNGGPCNKDGNRKHWLLEC